MSFGICQLIYPNKSDDIKWDNLRHVLYLGNLFLFSYAFLFKDELRYINWTYLLIHVFAIGMVTPALIDKGILYGDSATIGFKFDCFRSYFLAEKFNTNEEIWLNIIKENAIRRLLSDI